MPVPDQCPFLAPCARRDDAEAVSVVYCELQAPLGPRASTTGKMLFAHAFFVVTFAALLAFDLNSGPPTASTAIVQVGLPRKGYMQLRPGLVMYENELCKGRGLGANSKKSSQKASDNTSTSRDTGNACDKYASSLAF